MHVLKKKTKKFLDVIKIIVLAQHLLPSLKTVKLSPFSL